MRNELASFEDRVRVIPGNHDNAQHLERVFGVPAGPPNRTTFVVRWADWQVIGLDSQQPGEVAGSLGRGQLNWLHAELRAHNQPAVLFLHHPPVAVGSAWLDAIGLQDAARFQQILADHPHVALVCAGHVHQPSRGALESAEVLTTPAVGPQFQPRTETPEKEGRPAWLPHCGAERRRDVETRTW